MSGMFKPATREKTKARVLLAGPSGSGKTRAALEIAQGLGERIAVIDSENRSASLYVGLNGLKFDVCELAPPYTYEKYLQAMRECFNSKAYDVLVIDSMTHVWSGEGGALERVDQKSANGGNKFTAFADITPQHNRLLSTITGSPIHILCTVRTKTAYVMEEKENRSGKLVQTPRKIGLAPIFREGVEYEFSVQLDISLDHEVTVSKTRITELDGEKFAPNELQRIGAALREFHDSGVLVPPSAPPNFTDTSWEAKHERVWAFYKNSSVVDQPLSSVPTDKLLAYIERLDATIKGPATSKTPETAANAKRASFDAVPYRNAARAELVERRKLEAEMAGADADTGEVPPEPEDSGETGEREPFLGDAA